jgi:hyperosmotically inducible periplasmic protein
MHQARHHSLVRALVLGGLMAVTATAATAQTPPDNTKVNKRDRAEGAVTADQQKETAADRDLASKIRRALTKDDTLSTYAHNVKIIAIGGEVTLKGPVRSDDEKKAVVAKAVEIAGKDKVKDLLSIAPAKPAKTE